MSALGNASTVNPTLLDVARELRKRGRGGEADYYLYAIPNMLILKGIYPEDAFTMTIDDVMFELNKPQPPQGWDNTIWGKAIVQPN